MRSRFLLLTTALLSLPVLAEAQELAAGIMIGPNVATFGGRRIVQADHKVGVDFGAYLSIPISASVVIQPELHFATKGARNAAYDYSDMPVDGFAAPPVGVYISDETRHDYLEIPVLLKLTPAPAGDRVRPFFVAGPYVGILLRTDGTYIRDYTSELHSADFGVSFGGGIEMGLLSLDARYDFGLSSIAKDFDSEIGLIRGEIENRAFSVLIGLRVF